MCWVPLLSWQLFQWSVTYEDIWTLFSKIFFFIIVGIILRKVGLAPSGNSLIRTFLFLRNPKQVCFVLVYSCRNTTVRLCAFENYIPFWGCLAFGRSHFIPRCSCSTGTLFSTASHSSSPSKAESVSFSMVTFKERSALRDQTHHNSLRKQQQQKNKHLLWFRLQHRHQVQHRNMLPCLLFYRWFESDDFFSLQGDKNYCGSDTGSVRG